MTSSDRRCLLVFRRCPPPTFHPDSFQRPLRVLGAPTLNAAVLDQEKDSSSTVTGTNLKWVTWNNVLPDHAVSMYNEEVDRNDYVCKYKCYSGFYNPSMGPYCHYPSDKRTHRGSPFEILVNKDNFDILQWEDGSHGSVPPHSVRTCPGESMYVGKNKFGLGEVSTKDKVFYLPWKDKVYKYDSYQVLTSDQNIVSQQIYDVKYEVDQSQLTHFPPEIVRQTSITNHECSSVKKSDTLSKTTQVQRRWQIASGVKFGVKTSITARIPFITSVGVELSTELTMQLSWENTLVEAITDSASVELTAPPNNVCTVTMERLKYRLQIPFTAHLRRTYGSGEVVTTSFSGAYDSVQIGEVRALVRRCEPLVESPKCP